MRSKLIAAIGAIAIAFLLVTNPVIADAAKQIGSGGIKNNGVKSVDIKNNNVKSVDIKNNQLKLVDLHTSTKSALETPAYEYVLPQGGASTASKTYSFLGLPAGSYLVDYDLVTDGSAASSIQCYLQASAAGPDREAFNWGVSQGSDSAVSGATVLDLTSAPPVLICSMFSGGTFTPFGGIYKSTVVFTRVDKKPAGSIVVSRPQAASGKPGPGAR